MINKLKYLQKPFKHEHVTYCWPLPILSKKLVLITSLPKKVFALGESIPIDLQIRNAGLVPIRKIRVSLQRKVFYSTKNSNCQWKSDVIKRLKFTLKNEDQLLEYARFCDFSIVVPSTTPSRSDLWSLPRITYKIIIKIYTTGLNTSVKSKIPIYIVDTLIDTLKPPPSYNQAEANDLPSYESS